MGRRSWTRSIALEALNERIMFAASPYVDPSYDLAGFVHENAATQVHNDVARTEIVFIDSGIDEIDRYLAELDSSEKNPEIHFLDDSSDGVHQIAEYLVDRTGVDALHLISHGSTGVLTLGNTVVPSHRLFDFQHDFERIGASLSEAADILIYGCDLARGETGLSFVQTLSDLTLADVAASDDLTGHLELGGDWELEIEVGAIETPSIGVRFMADYRSGLLGGSFELDWSSIAWETSENKHTYTLASDSGDEIDVTISVEGNSNGTPMSDHRPTSPFFDPGDMPGYSGGIDDLVVAWDPDDSQPSPVTIRVWFTIGGTGENGPRLLVSDLSYRIDDVDSAPNHTEFGRIDQVTLTGIDDAGQIVLPSLAPLHPQPTFSVSGNMAIGNEVSDNSEDDSRGAIQVDYASSIIEAEIVYDEVAGTPNPAWRNIGLFGFLTFDRAPLDYVDIDNSVFGSNTSNRDGFGYAVAIDGDWAVVGARLEDSAALNAGAAYVFHRSTEGSWEEAAMLTAPDGAPGDFFGRAVSISNDNVVIGAPLHDTNGKSNSGAAYLFSKDQGGANSWGLVEKLTDSSALADSQFGYSLEIDGDYVAVGAWLDDDVNRSGSNHGSVVVFGVDEGGDSGWSEVKKIWSGNPSGQADSFGYSVSLDGGILAVGAHRVGKGNAGAVYIYEKDLGGNAAWGEVTAIANPEPDSGDNFGYSVSLDGGVLVVGSPFDDTPLSTPTGKNAGAAYVFSEDAAGVGDWSLAAKLVPDATVDAFDRETNDRFGWSVAIESGEISVGSPFANGMTGSSGIVYKFQHDEGGLGNWGSTDKVRPSTVKGGDRFGYAVSSSGPYSVYGAPRHDSIGVNAGVAYFGADVSSFAAVAVSASNVPSESLAASHFPAQAGFSLALASRSSKMPDLSASEFESREQTAIANGFRQPEQISWLYQQIDKQQDSNQKLDVLDGLYALLGEVSLNVSLDQVPNTSLCRKQT